MTQCDCQCHLSSLDFRFSIGLNEKAHSFYIINNWKQIIGNKMNRPLMRVHPLLFLTSKRFSLNTSRSVSSKIDDICTHTGQVHNDLS